MAESYIEQLQQRLRESEEGERRLREALQRVDAINDSPATYNSDINVVVSAALVQPHVKEPPYYVRSFWSPCRKYIITACVPSPGSDICVVDDDGRQWEATGPVEDMTNVELVAQTTQGERQEFDGCEECLSPWKDAHAGDCRVANGMKKKESGNG